MKREDHIRRVEEAEQALVMATSHLAEVANPVNQLRRRVAGDWQWWLPGAAIAGFVLATFRRPPSTARPARSRGGAPTGAAFWIPTLLRLLPAASAQLIPLFLSLRNDRKP